MREFWVITGEYDSAAEGLAEKCAELAEERGLKLKVYTAGDGGPEYEKAACEALTALYRRQEPEAVIFERTDFLSHVASAFAVRIGRGITADCTALEWSGDYGLLQIRPTFGGRKTAYNISTAKPYIASVRRGTFPTAGKLMGKTEIHPLGELAPDPALCRIEELEENILRLESADIILSGGLGLGSRENYRKLTHLAALCGAQPGASRAAVAAGYTSYLHQVGQTGITVSPKLYVAFGISGAVQHLSGIMNAGQIVAVNTDDKAPIRDYCDYFIKADAVRVIDILTKKFEDKSFDTKV